jgi:hypothetical protein
MGEIVNLRRVKRQRARDAAAEQAQENRVRHGRTGAQKAADALAAQRRETDAANHRLDPPRSREDSSE